MESILDSIKILLNIEPEDTSFDKVIIVDINTAFMFLNQIGVGPSSGFSIKDANDIWSDYLGDRTDIEGVKSYIHLKTSLVFDPPQASYLLEAIKNQISELEWRLTQ